MKTRLSNSAIDRYKTCGQSYRLHYIDRIRPTTKRSPLIFGDAMDKALTDLIEGKSDYLDVFNQTWSFNRIENDVESIPENINVRYFMSDLDEDLLTDEDKLLLSLKAKELNLENVDIVSLKKQKNYDNMSEDEIRLFNLTCWLSVRNKAKYMLESYKDFVIPKIVKVHSVQREIKLENDEGDLVTGFADLDIDYKHTDGNTYRVIADNKTSSIEYKPDSVATSQQLGIYCMSEGIKHAVYFVIQKKIRRYKSLSCKKCGYNGKNDAGDLTGAKSCDNVVLSRRCKGEWDVTLTPYAKIDVFFDEITDFNKEKILDTIDDVNSGIKNGVFEKNPNSCNNFGGCDYKDYCWKSSMKGLKKYD